MTVQWRSVSIGAAVAAVSVGLLWAADLPRELGVDEVRAKEIVISALSTGSVPVSLAKSAFAAAGPADRKRLVEGALAWAKAYAGSPELAAAYAQARDDSKPSPPQAAASPEETLKQQRAEQEKQIEEMKKAVASMPPEQRPAMEETIKQVTAAIAQMQNDPQMQQLQRQAIEAEHAQAQEQYAAELKQWEEEHPVDPRSLIAQRLRDFLDVCNDVDFDAKLVPSGDKMRFAEQGYEQKRSEWKLCFRAGKEVVTSARAFATEWLGELEAK